VTRITRSPALADSAVGVTVFLDGFGATGNLILGWILVIAGTRAREVGVRSTIGFDAVVSPQMTTTGQCVARNIAC